MPDTTNLDYGLEMLADMQMIVPASNKNRPGTKTPAQLTAAGLKGWPPYMRGNFPDEIVIHDTANTAPGANAIMHGNFLRNGGGDANVSFHAGADSERVVQYLPWNETCFAAGDGYGTGNTDSINIEMCVNRDGVYSRMLERTEVFVAKLMHRFDIPIEKVRQHNYRSSYHKDCPHSLRQINGGWEHFLAAVQEAYNSMSAPPPPNNDPIVFQETGKAVAQDFYNFWSANGGVPIFGYPIRDETNMTRYDGVVIRVQSFERARFERHPKADGATEVKLGLVEVERLTLLGR